MDYVRYTTEVEPLLDDLLNGGDTRKIRAAFTEASRLLTEARHHREYPWTPIHSLDHQFEKGISILDGEIPKIYERDRVSFDLMTNQSEDISDPRLVREHYLRDYVFGIIVEGLCVPWELDFPPVHVVTWSLGWDLYKHSKKFENALCADIYTRSRKLPYEIYAGEDLVDGSLIDELAVEIARIASPGSNLWENEDYRNLYLLLQKGASPPYRIVASYI